MLKAPHTEGVGPPADRIEEDKIVSASTPSTDSAVQRANPPKAVYHIINPVLRAILRSPLHRLISDHLMILHVTGRRTGRRYDIPVGHHTVDGQCTAVTSAGWRRNLRGGADVEVTVRGQRRQARADLVEEPDEVAKGYGSLLDEMGHRNARRLGLAITVDRRPTHEELARAAERDGLSLVRLDVEDRPAVERVHPPGWMMRVVNPLMRSLLVRGRPERMAEQLMLLHFRGRTTGTAYDVPVGRRTIRGRTAVLTNSGWRVNFREGGDLEVTLRGRRLRAHASLTEDLDEVTEIYDELIDELGRRGAARRLGIRFTVDRRPTRDELRAMVERSELSVLWLDLEDAGR